jgi:hypothetical protein
MRMHMGKSMGYVALNAHPHALQHTHVHAGEDFSGCEPNLWLGPIYNVVVQYCLVHSAVNRRVQSSAWRSEKH